MTIIIIIIIIRFQWVQGSTSLFLMIITHTSMFPHKPTFSQIHNCFQPFSLKSTSSKFKFWHKIQEKFLAQKKSKRPNMPTNHYNQPQILKFPRLLKFNPDDPWDTSFVPLVRMFFGFWRFWGLEIGENWWSFVIYIYMCVFSLVFWNNVLFFFP